MKFRVIIFIFLLFMTQVSLGQSNVIPLWEDKIPNSQSSDETEKSEVNGTLRISKVQTPTLQVFLPSERNATGKAVVICPGGGYSHLAYDWEGTDIAKWFNAQGIAAFVLKYRLPQSKSIIIQHEAPLQDAQRAIRLVRFHAEKWKVDRDKIGVVGFSAGGHLASTLGTQFDKKIDADGDQIDKVSARPDFMALIYPVISMKHPITHQGSRNNLLGNNPSETLVNEYSNELQVNNKTPQTFIVHSTDDKAVPVENSLNFYKALKDVGVKAEMHIYPEGGHGYALAINRGYLKSWTNRLADWLSTI